MREKQTILEFLSHLILVFKKKKKLPQKNIKVYLIEIDFFKIKFHVLLKQINLLFFNIKVYWNKIKKNF